MAKINDNKILPNVNENFIISRVGKEVTFESKLCIISRRRIQDLSIEWYKNGEVITPSDNMKIYEEDSWHRLELKCVTKEDEGIYTLLLRSGSLYGYTKYILYIKTDPYDNITYSLPHVFDGNVKQNLLRCCNLVKEKYHALQVTFVEDIKSIKWYKNNNQKPRSYPTLRLELNDYSTFSLILNKAKERDTGMYFLGAMTCDQKYIYSFSEVIVGSEEIVNVYKKTIPHLWKSPPFIEVYEKDDVRLIFKVLYDKDTIIEWTKNGKDVKLSDRIRVDMYGNTYIALKLYNVTCSDSGDYYLILRDNVSPTVATYGRLTVNKYLLPRPLPCIVTKTLTPSVVGVGNGVTFQCSFNTGNLKYTYGLWMVGKHTIDRSSPRFKVMSSGNEFVLHITSALPDMTGEVVCQLRQHLPDGKSLYICNTRAYITVLPDVAMEEEKKSLDFLTDRNIYNDQSATISIPRQIAPCQPPTIKDVILFFKFTKTSANSIFFTLGEPAPLSDVTEISVCKMQTTGPNAPIVGKWIFQWVRPAQTEWYAIDLCQSDGMYKLKGFSRTPSFVIKDPPEDTLFNFRIRLIRPTLKSKIRTLQFSPQKGTPKKTKSSKLIHTNAEFNRLYVHGMRLERGSFGVINVVRHYRHGQLYITKTMTFANQVHRNMVRLEFDIVKRLVHPHTVTLVKGFSTRYGNGIILLMEYLWGNELLTKEFDRGNEDETDIMSYIRQILLALKYLHSKKIAHLAINPENIVYVNRHSRRVKLVDFSTAKIVKKPVTVPATCGNYVPPEIIHNEAVGTYSDMWNVGVITYWLLTHQLPFRGLSNITLGRNITRGAYLYDEFDVRTVSDRAKVFVSSLLRRHPGDRLTAEMALRDTWVTEGPEEGRPKKVQIQGYGGLRILDRRQGAIMRWKRAILAACATIFFLAQRNLGESMSISDSSSDSSL